MIFRDWSHDWSVFGPALVRLWSYDWSGFGPAMLSVFGQSLVRLWSVPRGRSGGLGAQGRASKGVNMLGGHSWHQTRGRSLALKFAYEALVKAVCCKPVFSPSRNTYVSARTLAKQSFKTMAKTWVTSTMAKVLATRLCMFLQMVSSEYVQGHYIINVLVLVFGKVQVIS